MTGMRDAQRSRGLAPWHVTNGAEKPHNPRKAAMMPKDIKVNPLEPLEALQKLVCDHGDAFRWSVSKRGRIWLTLTHWDTEKYNTSVELDGMSSVDDMLDGLLVLVFAHYAKCFLGQAHSDTWLGTDATRALVPDARDAVRSMFAPGQDTARSDPPTATGQQ